MTSVPGNSPDLLTLLGWAERDAAGDRVESLERWRSASSTHEQRWRWIARAQRMLDEFQSVPAPTLPPELVADYLDRVATPTEAREVEAACWRELGNLVELLSAFRFAGNAAISPAVSADLSNRLKQLVPDVAVGTEPAIPTGIPVGSPVVPPVPTVVVAAAARRDRRRWKPASMALWGTVVALVGLLLTLAAIWSTSRPAAPAPGTVVQSPEPSPNGIPSPEGPSPPEGPTPAVPETPPQDSENRSPQPVYREPPPNDDRGSPAARPTSDPPRRSPDDPPSGRDRIERPSRPAVADRRPFKMQLQTPTGLVLVDSPRQQGLRTAPAQLTLDQPTRMLALAETWSSADVPRVGRLILGEETDATLSTSPEGDLDIDLQQGQIAIEGLEKGRKVQVHTDEATWTATSTGDYSTMAVVYHLQSPTVFVPQGIIAIDGQEYGQNEIINWENGVRSSATRDAAADMTSDVGWLQPPSADEARQWKERYGELAERLERADDLRAELRELLADSKDPQLRALVSRWDLFSGGASPELFWQLLNDYQAAVRVATIEYLIEPQTRDHRFGKAGRMLQMHLGNETARLMAGWLNTLRRGAPASPALAHTLVSYLGHDELVVRQVAVFCLERFTRDAFAMHRQEQPRFDAGASSRKRIARQVEWKQAVLLLYGPAIDRRNRTPTRAQP